MKTYSLQNNTRIWTSRLFAVGLGLFGFNCFAAAPAAPADKSSGNTGNAGIDSQAWENQTFDQMRHIQQEMNDLFRDTTSDLNSDFPRFDASATVQDRGDNYVASFYLPKRDLAHVKVNVKDGILIVRAGAEQTIKNNNENNNSATAPGAKNESNSATAPGANNENNNSANKNEPNTNTAGAGSETEMLNEYEQLVSLPGPVDAGKMKVEKHGDSVIVTIPKADAKENKTASANK